MSDVVVSLMDSGCSSRSPSDEDELAAGSDAIATVTLKLSIDPKINRVQRGGESAEVPLPTVRRHFISIAPFLNSLLMFRGQPRFRGRSVGGLFANPSSTQPSEY